MLTIEHAHNKLHSMNKNYSKISLLITCINNINKAVLYVVVKMKP